MLQTKKDSKLSGGNKSSLRNKKKNSNWKVRLQAYMDSIDEDMFDVIISGPYIRTKLTHTSDNPNKMVEKLKASQTYFAVV